MSLLKTFEAKLHHVVQTGHTAALDGILADSFVLHTPRFMRPVTDRQHCLAILQGIIHLLPDMTYHRSWTNDDSIAMEFKGHVRNTEVLVHGLDIFTIDSEGKASELTVFLRPTKALETLGAVEDELVKSSLKQGGALS